MPSTWEIVLVTVEQCHAREKPNSGCPVCIILFAGKYFICKVYFLLTLLFRPWQRCDVDVRTRKPRCGSLHRFLNYWHTSKWHWSCAFSIAENLVKVNIFIKIYIHLSQKTGHSTLAHIFPKYWPIFTFFSPSDWAVIM